MAALRKTIDREAKKKQAAKAKKPGRARRPKWLQTATHYLFSGGVCSQWHKCRFTYEGVEYSSAEQCMMAAKARLFEDEKALAAIVKEHRPAQVKALGRKVANFDSAKWEQHVAEHLVQWNVAKLGSSAALKKALLDTGERAIAEMTRDDKYGTGKLIEVNASTGQVLPACVDESQWVGQNLLGKALMAARTQLRVV